MQRHDGSAHDRHANHSRALRRARTEPLARESKDRGKHDGVEQPDRRASDHPETRPLVLAEISSSEMTTAAAHDSTLPGEKTLNTYAPMNRPTIAPPQ